jgi:hypothetical protein
MFFMGFKGRRTYRRQGGDKGSVSDIGPRPGIDNGAVNARI